jgi:hypothetical protein
MSQTQILLWCIALIVLELNHLKWIWWTYWERAKCGRKQKDCDCGLRVGHVPNSVQRSDRLIFDLYEITPEDLLLIRSYRRVRPGHLAERGA